MFGDEASFWLDGTLHVTWSKVGVQPRVDTFGDRKTAHVYGAVSIERRPHFVYQFADNGPSHGLEDDGQRWLADHRHRIELFRLPTYSPELNGIEGVWKVTKKTTTHNRFYRTVDERDQALVSTFETFKDYPQKIAGHVARFL
jgi:hypothetical protein